MRGKRAMMNSAKRRILLVDHTKFNKVALQARLLRAFDLVAGDSGIDEAQSEKLQECSVPFEIVPL